MPNSINKGLIGKEFPPFVVTIERGKIKEFARAIGDDNPAYLDDRVGEASEWGDIIAPPTFMTTFREAAGDGGEFLRELGTDISRLLHGEQEFEMHRPIRPGETFVCRSRVTDIYEKTGRSGAMGFVVRETAVTDRANEIVATIRSDHGGAAMKYARTYLDDVKVGDELPPVVKGPLQQIQLTRYAGASGDFNPIHQDHEFAKAAGMSDVFAHGMLSMGFVGQLVTDWAGAGNVRKLGVRFAGIVRLKDTITCRGRVLGKAKDLVDLEIWAENQRGEKVVTGKATVTLPPRG